MIHTFDTFDIFPDSREACCFPACHSQPPGGGCKLAQSGHPAGIPPHNGNGENHHGYHIQITLFKNWLVTIHKLPCSKYHSTMYILCKVKHSSPKRLPSISLKLLYDTYDTMILVYIYPR